KDEFTGVVVQRRLNANSTQQVVTYTVVVSTDNSSGKLLPYLTAMLQFKVQERKDVLKVPAAALKWRPKKELVAPDVREDFAQRMNRKKEGGGQQAAAGDKDQGERGTVWVSDDGFVRPVRVEIGITDGNMVEVVKVLHGGKLEKDMPLVVGEQS